MCIICKQEFHVNFRKYKLRKLEPKVPINIFYIPDILLMIQSSFDKDWQINQLDKMFKDKTIKCSCGKKEKDIPQPLS